MIQLQNISILSFTEHKSYLWYKNFPKIFDKNFFLYKTCSTPLFYFPKCIPKIFQNFSSRPFNIEVSLTFSLFEICSCQSFLISKFLLLLFSSLLLKMNSHFNLDYSKLLHFWFTHPPMMFHNSLTTRLKSLS